MGNHEARNQLVDSRRGSAQEGNGHPELSAADRNSLAERIALIDGVTSAQAHRQINEMMSTDLGAAIEKNLQC